MFFAALPWVLAALPGPASQEPGEAIQAAAHWLVAHQVATAGYWDTDDFGARCPRDGPACEGGGNPVADVGVTALAVMALLAAAEVPGVDVPDAAGAAARGLAWLGSIQGPAGLIGDEVGNPTLYNHALATQALADAVVRGGPDAEALRRLEAAVWRIVAARNGDGGWGYGLQGNGASDSSVTGWALLALARAEVAGVTVPEEVFRSAATFLEGLTDPDTGRCGYNEESSAGGPPARLPGAQGRFPPERSESLTALALRAGSALAARPGAASRPPWPEGLVDRQVALLLRKEPDPKPGSRDLYYWVHADAALRRVAPGGSSAAWRAALWTVLSDLQERRGHAAGSWAPDCVWGEEGGRVYATAMALWSLALAATPDPLAAPDPAARKRLRNCSLAEWRTDRRTGKPGKALAAALPFLLRFQQEEGAFPGIDHGLPAFRTGPVGTTALAAMALQAGGKKADQARGRALDWLEDQVARIPAADRQPSLRDQALACLALARAVQAGGASRVLPTRRALDLLARRVARKPEADELFWAGLVLRSALESSLAPATPATREAAARVDAWFAARPGTEDGQVGEGALAPRRTAAGLLWGLLREDLPRSRKRKHLPDTLATRHDHLLALPAAPGAGGPGTDPFYWWLGAEAVRAWGGSHWSRWRNALEEALLATQEQAGPEAGSWVPAGGSGSRLGTTLLALLALTADAHRPRIF